MEFDEVFQYIGHFGIYQLCLYLLLGLTSFIGAYEVISMTFIGAFPEHWCKVERLSNFNHTLQKYIAIPFDKDDNHEKCRYYSHSYTNLTDDDLLNWDRYQNNDSEIIQCNEWVYDQSQYLSSIVTQWDMACDNTWLVSLVSTFWLLGILVGAPLSGFLSDKFGRKITLCITSVLHVLLAWAMPFSVNFPMFTTLRFLLSVAQTMCYLCGFVIVMEIIGPKYRTAAGLIFQIFFSAGFMLAPGIAYFVRDHITLMYILAAPVALTLSYFILVPESPRWLVIQNKTDNAMKILQRIAKTNHVQLPQDMKLTVGNSGQKKGTIKDIFTSALLRKQILIVYLGWFTCSLIYYGLSLNTDALVGSVYLNTFLSGAVEVPANLLCILFMEKIGRRITLGGSFIFGGIACLLMIIGLYYENLDWLQTTFAMLGKAAITMSFSCIYNYTAELFPTPVRHVAVGSSSMMARVSGLMSPYMGGPMMDFWKPLPSIIFGTFSIASGIFSLMLPETMDRKMPDSVEEAEYNARLAKSKDKPVQGFHNSGFTEANNISSGDTHFSSL